MTAPRAARAGGRPFRRSSPLAHASRASRVVAVALVGLVVGGLLGVAVGATRHPTRSATALMSVQADPLIASNLGAAGNSPSDDQVQASFATQLARLSSAAFATEVQRAVGGGPVQLQVTQVQSSSVVDITALDRSGARAHAVAAAALAIYERERRGALSAELAQQAKTVQGQLTATQQALTALPPTPATTSNAVDAQRSALENSYLTLLGANSAVVAAQAQNDSVVRTIQESTLSAPAGLDARVTDGLVGAALGALLAALLVVLARRASSAVHGEDDLEGHGLALISPAVPHRRLRAEALDDPLLQRVVAAQEPQLGGHDVVDGLVVVGPTSGVGSTTVAVQHALYSARRRPTLLVLVGGEVPAVVADGLGVDTTSTAHRQLSPEQLRAADLEQVLQVSSYPDLAVLALGPDAESGTADLEALLDAGLVPAARELGWHVVLDAPALDVSTAGLRGMRHCGASVLVVASGRTRHQEVERALDALARWRVQASGVVLNEGAPRRAHRAGGLVPFREAGGGASDFEHPALHGSAAGRGAHSRTPGAV